MFNPFHNTGTIVREDFLVNPSPEKATLISSTLAVEVIQISVTSH